MADVRPIGNYDGSLQEIPDSDKIPEELLPVTERIDDLYKKFNDLVEYLEGLGFEFPDNFNR